MISEYLMRKVRDLTIHAECRAEESATVVDMDFHLASAPTHSKRCLASDAGAWVIQSNEILVSDLSYIRIAFDGWYAPSTSFFCVSYSRNPRICFFSAHRSHRSNRSPL